MNSISRYIKNYRFNNNVSQYAFAKTMGVCQQNVAKWELGITSPRAALLPKLAKVLGCTIDELMADGEQEEAEEDQTTNMEGRKCRD